MCVGAVWSLSGVSTVRNRSADGDAPAWGGRRRRKTRKRLCDLAGAEELDVEASIVKAFASSVGELLDAGDAL